MSVSLAVFCERTGCKARASMRLHTGELLLDLAARLVTYGREIGWATTDDGVDLCPQHAQEAAS